MQQKTEEESSELQLEHRLDEGAVKAIRTIAFIFLTSILSCAGGLSVLYARFIKDPAPFYARIEHPYQMIVATALLLLAAVVVSVWLPLQFCKNAGWHRTLLGHLEEHTKLIDALPAKRLWFWILLASALGLFCELLMIRLQASYFQMFAHFKNVSLMSCFLGLGIGYMRGRKWPLTTPFLLPLLCFQVVFLYFLRYFDLNVFLQNPGSEEVTMGLPSASNIVDMFTAYGFLVFVFLFNALCFIPPGQLASHLMGRLSKLESYSWNLIGSLAGIVLFSVLSFLWAPPVVWLFLACLGCLIFLRGRSVDLFAGGIAAVLLLGSASVPVRAFQLDVYSPYQILTVVFGHEYPEVRVNNAWLQNMLDLSPRKVAEREYLKPWSDYYALPYSFKPEPEDVLIIGSGTGNDVASAIRQRAKHIDAVEIDPAIVCLGQNLHPEYPYQFDQVKITVNDARNFMRHTDKKYDLIVYALLDSHTSMSAVSGAIRMDNYIYTVQALREARQRLKPGGVLIVTVCIIPQFGLKIFQMIREAFDGQVPIAYHTAYDSGFSFLIGDNIQKPSTPPPFEELTAQYSENKEKVDLSTDDWPFFFMYKRTFPFTFAAVIIVLLALSVFVLRRVIPVNKQEAGLFSWPCFFLGAGFMLVETKGITELALVYGSTWLVTSIVIGAILIMAFAANLLVMKIGAPNRWLTYGLLAASLAAGYYMSLNGTATVSAFDQAVMTFVLTLPLFFSGFAFSAELQRSSSIGVALYSNLLGAMVGGFLEYSAMACGYRFLYIAALAMYLLAFAFSEKAPPQG